VAMRVQDREPINSTALRINVKLGLLPLQREYLQREYLITGDNSQSEGKRIAGPLAGRGARLAELSHWLLGRGRSLRRSPDPMESARRHSRLIPRLGLVWSRREKIGFRDSRNTNMARSTKE
jgi:hypothetical protein